MGLTSARICLLVTLGAVAWLPALASDQSPAPFVNGSWTLVVLPDTHHGEDIFTCQTQWIVANQHTRDIRFVVNEGDITDGSREQWERAQRSISVLDGKVPYALVTGNHDYVDGLTALSDYFPVSRYRPLPTFGGVYKRDRLENSYHLFSAGGRDWLVIALEFGPTDSAVRWADVVLKKYPTRSAIIVTHAYLYSDNARYDHITRQDQKWSPRVCAHGPNHERNDGEELWRELVSPNPNVAFVLCGHVLNDGAGRLTSTGEHGNTVHQILINCQMMENRGSGYLRLMEFLPDGKAVRFRTYSPYLDKYLTDDEHDFALPLPPSPTPSTAMRAASQRGSCGCR